MWKGMDTYSNLGHLYLQTHCVLSLAEALRSHFDHLEAFEAF